MVILEGNSLVFRFDKVHEHAKIDLHFERTLRIPDDGKTYPLPAGFGPFQLRRLDDHEGRVPDDWTGRGGVIMPVYQAEAMFIAFDGGDYPCAVKVGAGKINAVSGKPWKPELDASERDYMVVPPQPWLDGFLGAKDVIRQFVAMPLGSGYSVEELIAGKADGYIQIVVYPMKGARYEQFLREREEEDQDIASAVVGQGSTLDSGPAREMSLGAGGRMHHPIYADRHGIDAWDQSVDKNRCAVTLVDVLQWHAITGAMPRTMPPTVEDYARANVPWFKDYASDQETLPGAPALARVQSVAEVAARKGERPPTDGDANPEKVIRLGPTRPRRLRWRKQGTEPSFWTQILSALRLR